MTMKKTVLTALAGVALLATPLAANAQHSGGHVGGYHAGGGGYHGGYGGYRGGFYRGGHGGYYGYGWGLGALGFALGAAWADPWYYGPAYYGYYGYYGPPAPVVYEEPVYGYAPPPPGAAPQSACGQWSWDQAHSKYNWVPGPCAPAPAPVQVN